MIYLLDTNVVSELGSATPHANVAAWTHTVDDTAMSMSVLTVAELRKGVERLRARTTGGVSMLERRSDLVDSLDAALTNLRTLFGARILPVTTEVADEWGRLKAHRDTDSFDLGIAATARRNGLTVVTRNLDDFRRRGVRVLDPFSRPPKVYEPGE
jgi:predicted nucleic acid-binding protein